MKLVTWQETTATQPKTGVILELDSTIEDWLVLDLATMYKAVNKSEYTALGSIQTIIEEGDAALEAIDNLREKVLLGHTEFTRPLNTIKLLAPLPRPKRLRCFSVYEAHMKRSIEAMIENKLGKTVGRINKTLGLIGIPKGFYKHPTYYKGNHLAIVGPDANVIHPLDSEMLDYELEMAMVIGKAGSNISVDTAQEHIFGYCCFNDFSARDLLVRDLRSFIGPQKGKDFDTSNALGPWLVTKDEIIDPYNLAMEVRVNGNVRGRSNTGTMYHPMSAMIEWASWNETIVPCEVFATGAAGNGCGIESWNFIGVGDQIEIEIEGLGILRNKIVGNPSNREYS